jgi:hypothetical protein
MQLGGVDGAQPHLGVDFKPAPDAHARRKCVAINDAQYLGRIGKLRIESGGAVSACSQPAAIGQSCGRRVRCRWRPDEGADA